MSDKQILVIGLHAALLETVIRLIHNHPSWIGTGVASVDEAEKALKKQAFDLVLITNGLDETSEAHLRVLVNMLQPQVPVIQHYGGGSGLLENEIRAALEYGINLQP